MMEDRMERARRFRERDFPRGDVSHDPMWTSGLDSLMGAPAPIVPTPTPEPLVLLPLPPVDPVAEKWSAVLALAGEVTERLKAEPDFDGALLSLVALDLVDDRPDADAIIAAYHRRKKSPP